MIEDGNNFGLMLALRHLLGRLESKGMMSYPETQRMLDEALGDVKRLRIEDRLTHKAAEDASRVIGELYHATKLLRPTPPLPRIDRGVQSERVSMAPAARSGWRPDGFMARRLMCSTPSVVVSP
jgi:hypothetical protein